jgi:hypothetical protein
MTSSIIGGHDPPIRQERDAKCVGEQGEAATLCRGEMKAPQGCRHRFGGVALAIESGLITDEFGVSSCTRRT